MNTNKDKWSKYKERTLNGIENLGNTCFINTTLQLLNHTYEFHEYMDTHTPPPASILTEWNELRSLFWTGGEGTIQPTRFIHAIQETAKQQRRDLFTSYGQNDMPEFLMFLLETIHTSISRPRNINITGAKKPCKTEQDILALECCKMLKALYEKEHSVITDLFYGVCVSEIFPKGGGDRHTVKTESYFMLDLPIVYYTDERAYACSTLYECMDAYHRGEYLEGENAWWNEKTGKKEDIVKRSSFWNFPKILVITLKRFSIDGEHKINTMVDFPIENLDLSRYVRDYNPSTYVYDLYGVCNHFGGVSDGHYTASVRNIHGEWIHYNDKYVERINGNENVVSPMAYCLFYRKKNNLV